MPHILFLSYDGMTDPLGQSQVIPYLSGLCEAGYRFTILSFDKGDKFAANKSFVEKLLSGLPIQWHSIPYHKSPPVISSVYDYYLMLKKVKELHKEDPFDMIHTRPGLPPLVALHMKKKHGVKFLNDIRGFWADERVDGGMWDLKNPLYKIVYRFFRNHEDKCVVEADHLVCLTYAAEKVLLSWKHLSVSADKITVVPCSADLDLFNNDKIDPEKRNALKKSLNISDSDVVFSYLGSIGGWYMTHEMLLLCKTISNKIPHAKFLFISPHRHDIIMNAATAHSLDPEKVITVSAGRTDVPVYLSLSSYSLFFIKPCYSKISSSPTKHGEIMSMGIPVITNTGVGDVADIVKMYDAGIVIEEFNEKTFDKVADVLAHGPIFDTAKIRNGAEKFYSLDEAVKKYTSVYRKVLGV